MTARKKSHPVPGGEIVLYQSVAKNAATEVRLHGESVWLSLNQIAGLFDRDKSVISRHLRNVYETKELDRTATIAYFATVQDESGRSVRRRIEYYNLDAILSVGYRVNSKAGTQFRIWATKVLKDHLIKGYSVNQKRLKELKRTVRLIADVAARKALTGDEAQALLKVVGDYAYALDLLDEYDHQRVRPAKVSPGRAVRLELEEARSIVERLRSRFGGSDLFGRERSAGLDAVLGAVSQTFGGKDLYRSVEEKAAHLLYLLVKNHPFVDGNKRIGAALFLWFLEKNGSLYGADGSKRIADNALVAITLLIAQSDPKEKGILTDIVANLIDRRN